VRLYEEEEDLQISFIVDCSASMGFGSGKKFKRYYGAAVSRKRRMEVFRQAMNLTDEARILDVGGYPWFWANSGVNAKITILNLHVVPELAAQFQGRYQLVVGMEQSSNIQTRNLTLFFQIASSST